MLNDVTHQEGVGEPDALERLWTPHRMAYILGENKPSDATSGECLSAPGAQLEQLPLRVDDGDVWIRVTA